MWISKTAMIRETAVEWSWSQIQNQPQHGSLSVCYTGSNICAEWGLGTRLVVEQMWQPSKFGMYGKPSEVALHNLVIAKLSTHLIEILFWELFVSKGWYSRQWTPGIFWRQWAVSWVSGWGAGIPQTYVAQPTLIADATYLYSASLIVYSWWHQHPMFLHFPRGPHILSKTPHGSHILQGQG